MRKDKSVIATIQGPRMIHMRSDAELEFPRIVVIQVIRNLIIKIFHVEYSVFK